MSDTTVKKIDAAHAPTGEMGQAYLVSGRAVALRLWTPSAKNSNEHDPTPRARDYETVGYVLEGRATLESEGSTLDLGPGDSWLVPAGATHAYKPEDGFRAVEATSPPARVAGRDDAPA